MDGVRHTVKQKSCAAACTTFDHITTNRIALIALVVIILSQIGPESAANNSQELIEFALNGSTVQSEICPGGYPKSVELQVISSVLATVSMSTGSNNTGDAKRHSMSLPIAT